MNPPNWESNSPGLTSHDPVWSSRIQWGAILAGALAGFGVVLLMTLLGAALGITASTVAGHNTENPTGDDAAKTAVAFGIGSGIWMILTAVATGIVAGGVLNSTSRRDRAYSPVIFGGLSWAVGVCAMLLVASPSLGGALSGLGAGAGGAASAASNIVTQRPDVTRMVTGDRSAENQSGQSRTGSEADRNRQKPMSEEEKAAAADAAKKAAKAATVATWTMLVSQLIALAATIVAAGFHRSARGVRPITELRPRPVPAP